MPLIAVVRFTMHLQPPRCFLRLVGFVGAAISCCCRGISLISAADMRCNGVCLDPYEPLWFSP